MQSHNARRPRRLYWSALVATIAAALALTAYSDAAEPATSNTGEEMPSEAASVFPATVDHRYGSTTIPSPPKRIVTVWVTEHDAVLALGTVPVGVTDWYGDQPYEPGHGHKTRSATESLRCSRQCFNDGTSVGLTRTR